MAWILLKPSNYKQVAPLVRTGGSRHTGLAALPHRNIQVVYRDGRAYSYASYCVSGDSDSQKGQLDKKEFRELCRLLRKFRKIPGAGEGCSGGTGYEMTVYNTEGAEEHRFYGYIRGNKCLKRLSDFICSIPGFYFEEYGPACRIIFN